MQINTRLSDVHEGTWVVLISWRVWGGKMEVDFAFPPVGTTKELRVEPEEGWLVEYFRLLLICGWSGYGT